MNIFVLTGAGVSAESGLGTFRDKDGLWAHSRSSKRPPTGSGPRAASPEQVRQWVTPP